MSLRLFDSPLPVSSHVAVITAALVLIATVVPKSSKLDAIPTFGPSSWAGSWFSGLNYLSNGSDMIRKGCEKYKSAPFKVSAFYNWLVIVSSREHVEELRKVPTDILSFAADLNDRTQMDYTMGPEICQNPYHVSIVRTQLTRNLDVLYPEIRDEIITTFDDLLHLNGNEWKSVPALSNIRQVVCRASNRAFVGLPLCRDPDWININIRHTRDITKGSILIRSLPDLLKPAAMWLFTSVYQTKQRARELLGPIIEKRQRYLTEYEHDDKPNDFLSWLMDEAEGRELSVESLTTRMLFINLAAIHTSSSSFTFALLYLAANPQYIRPLREEVENAVEEGWSRDALAKMQKVDSFLKECQRLEGLNFVTLQRKALKDFTFSDGTFVPKGTVIAVDSRSVHCNELYYENPLAFEPFRFAHMSDDSEDGYSTKHHYVSTSVEYLSFGHGRQACPGRFFAATLLKTMLAHTVVAYDIGLEEGAPRPRSSRLMTVNLPDPCAKVVFRRRVG